MCKRFFNNFRHTFREFYKVETWYTLGKWVDVSYITKSGCCCCLFVPLFLHFSFSPFFCMCKLFWNNFRRSFFRNCEAYTVETWYTLEKWAGGVRLLLHIRTCFSSFFFLASFQTLNIKYFVAFFSGTVGPTKLKLDTNEDNGCIGCTGIRLLLHICPFISSFFFFSNFSPIFKY